MKKTEQIEAKKLRNLGYSIVYISTQLNVAKSSVSLWVRDIVLPDDTKTILKNNSHSSQTVEKRRTSRLANEMIKRNIIIDNAKDSVRKISAKELWLIGVMLYWAEGGKTQRMVRFSNGDPEMIRIMMSFFRNVCLVPESKFRGYIHIHQHLDAALAEDYWCEVSSIPKNQFFKTYNKPNKSSQNKKDSLPNGVFDIYVMDTKLFYKINGWAKGVFSSY